MRQQKFLELLENGDITRALAVLRTELTPLNQNEEKLHSLARYVEQSSLSLFYQLMLMRLVHSLMMCVSPEDLRKNAGWDGAAGLSRRQLLSELSSVYIPSSSYRAVLISHPRVYYPIHNDT